MNKLLLGTMLIASMTISTNSFAAAHGKMKMKMSHAHMGHVSTKWVDTPNHEGLLTTAMKEAKIAMTHATIATRQLNNLGWLKLHTTHVVNAINPAIIAKGPGLGYGLIKAAKGVEKHINLAANSADASGNVKAHAVHIATSAHNSIVWANDILKLAPMLKNATTAAQAAPLAKQIQQLSVKILDGFDANGDGQVTWVKGEGGLNESLKHLGIMQKGEGMASMM